MLLQHFMEGGPLGMGLIYILWIITIVLIGLLALRLIKNEKSNPIKNKKLSELILFLGSLTFLLGILWQIIGMLQALKAIQLAGDISPGLIAEGLRISMFSTSYGFILFIISFIAWFFNRRFNN